jgi:hypothetical protein
MVEDYFGTLQGFCEIFPPNALFHTHVLLKYLQLGPFMVGVPKKERI